MKFTTLFSIIPVIVLLQGCSGSSTCPPVAHHWDVLSSDWIIELPPSATDQEIISNYFAVLYLHNGRPVPGERIAFTGTDGRMIAVVTNSVQKIKRYRIVDLQYEYCGAPEASKRFTLDTDQGRKWVRIESARNHSDNPNASGWRCDIEDVRTNIDSLISTNNAHP